MCVCLSVCLSALSRSHFLIDFRQNGHKGNNPQNKNEFVGVNIAPPLPYFAPNLPFWTNYADFCFKYSQIAGILASYRKSGSINTLVTSDFRTEVEIRQFCACTLKKYAMQPLFVAESQKFLRLTERLVLFSVRTDGNQV